MSILEAKAEARGGLLQSIPARAMVAAIDEAAREIVVETDALKIGSGVVETADFQLAFDPTAILILRAPATGFAISDRLAESLQEAAIAVLEHAIRIQARAMDCAPWRMRVVSAKQTIAKLLVP